MKQITIAVLKFKRVHERPSAFLRFTAREIKKLGIKTGKSGSQMRILEGPAGRFTFKLENGNNAE